MRPLEEGTKYQLARQVSGSDGTLLTHKVESYVHNHVFLTANQFALAHLYKDSTSINSVVRSSSFGMTEKT